MSEEKKVRLEPWTMPSGEHVAQLPVQLLTTVSARESEGGKWEYCLLQWWPGSQVPTVLCRLFDGKVHGADGEELQDWRAGADFEKGEDDGKEKPYTAKAEV